MAWESTFLPKMLDIPTSSPDLDTLRTPIDPISHPHQPPWYTQSFPALHRGYEHFQRDIDLDDVPPSPPRRMLELLQADLQFDLSPPSPSRRAFVGLPSTQCIYPPPPYDHYADCPSPPSLSPPSPSRRSLALLPSPEEPVQWHPHQATPDLEDCPELSPPSPRHSPLGLLMEDFPLEEPMPQSDLPIFPTDSSLLLQHEHAALLSLRDRTLLAERTSRARNVALRTHERALAKLVAGMREREPAEEAPGAPCTDSPQASGDRPNALRTCRATATQVMLERIELKRKRKQDKERLRELRVILGVGVEGLLGDSDWPGVATKEPGVVDVQSAGGEGLGLMLDQVQGQAQAQPHLRHHSNPLSACRIQTRLEAMSRLVARMAIRRREIGMRSLLEAGSLAEVGGSVEVERAGKRGLSPLRREEGGDEEGDEMVDEEVLELPVRELCHEKGYQEGEEEGPTEEYDCEVEDPLPEPLRVSSSGHCC